MEIIVEASNLVIEMVTHFKQTNNTKYKLTIQNVKYAQEYL